MKPALKWVRRASLVAALLAMGSAAWAQGAAPAAQASATPGYTTAEYNAYNAAKNTADPAAKVKALEAFVARVQQSDADAVRRTEICTRRTTRRRITSRPSNTSTSCWRLGDKVDARRTGWRRWCNRGQAYGAGATDPALQTPDMLTKTREASAQGLTALDGAGEAGQPWRSAAFEQPEEGHWLRVQFGVGDRGVVSEGLARRRLLRSRRHWL